MKSKLQAKGMPENLNDLTFWHEVKNEKGDISEIVIDTGKLIDTCSILGYHNYIDHNEKYVLVKVIDNIVEIARVEDIKQDIQYLIRHIFKRPDVWKEFIKRPRITIDVIHNIRKLPPSSFNISTKDKAYFYYKNGVVEVSGTGFKLIPYSSFEGLVWKHQIKQRNYVDCRQEYKKSPFFKFLENICDNNLMRFSALFSIIGYLLHPYKDPSFAKAVILIDEKLDFTGEAKGGTGKSLVAKALSHITTLVLKDGKNFNTRENFIYDDVKQGTGILYIDDATPKFQLDTFYSFITGPLKVNRKYEHSYTIPFALSPKLLITSNYMVKGSGGETDQRRRIEVEIASYYSIDRTPYDDFNHILFDEWDENQWHLFDSLMMRAVGEYTRKGVIMPPKINLIENTLISETDVDFVLFMDSIRVLQRIDKKVLLDKFIELNPTMRWKITQTTFNRWLEKWGLIRKYNINHNKSNGKSFITFFNNDSEPGSEDSPTSEETGYGYYE